MIQVMCKKVRIRKSELATMERVVPAWEAPVLEALWGPAYAEVAELWLERVPPSAENEYTRLETVYKQSETEDGSKSGVTYIASVYGQFGVGIRNLDRAIRDAVRETAEAPYDESDISDLLMPA
jgi:hypothetical protein